MKLLGVDPDMSGGLALVSHPDRNVLAIRRMPILSPRPPLMDPARIDPTGFSVLVDEARSLGAEFVVLERAVVRPQKGKTGPVMQQGIDRTHQNFGAIRAICELAFTPSRVMLASPSAWKKALGLSSDKAESRAMAIDFYPDHETLLKKVKNTGLAEALLLTEWGRDQF